MTTAIHSNGSTTPEAIDTKPLWAALDEAQDSLAMANEEVLVHEKAVSDACTAIVKATGKTGWLRKGERIKFAKRKKSDVYFVRKSHEVLEEVED
jgi:hypothetical protein